MRAHLSAYALLCNQLPGTSIALRARGAYQMLPRSLGIHGHRRGSALQEGEVERHHTLTAMPGHDRKRVWVRIRRHHLAEKESFRNPRLVVDQNE